jgi:outer membrane biosynthesis protein TonB
VSSDDRRIPVWVPFATAVAGALVGFGLVTTLASDGDETELVAAVGAPTTTATDLEPVFLEPDAQPTATPAPAATPTAPPEPTPEPTAEPTATPAPTAVPQPTPTPAPPRPTAAPAAPAPEPPATAPASGTTITRQQAGAIAAAHVGGTVDSIDRESDYGAAWDVDVYAPDGEYTIYVSATGQIVRIEGPFRD